MPITIGADAPEAAELLRVKFARAPLALIAVEQFGNPGESVTRRVAVVKHAPTQLVLHLVPEGDATLGMPELVREALADELLALDLEEGAELLSELPPATVARIEAYCISPRPLTWGDVLTLGQAGFASAGGDSERALLTRDQAQLLVREGLRLPTAAELEWAARGGRDGAFFWGNDLPDVQRWNEGPEATDAESTNAFGLTDVLSSREWCTEAGCPVVKGGAADLYPWQGSEALLMLPALTEAPAPGERAALRLVVAQDWASTKSA